MTKCHRFAGFHIDAPHVQLTDLLQRDSDAFQYPQPCLPVPYVTRAACAARVARRLGAREVTVAYRRRREEMPALADEPAPEPLTEAQVKELFGGNTEEGNFWRGGRDTGKSWKSYYAADGTLRRINNKGEKEGGVWFVDPIGRHCFRLDDKERTKCDVIVPEDTSYARLRDGEKRGVFQMRDDGLHPVADPSSVFLIDRRPGTGARSAGGTSRRG